MVPEHTSTWASLMPRLGKTLEWFNVDLSYRNIRRYMVTSRSELGSDWVVWYERPFKMTFFVGPGRPNMATDKKKHGTLVPCLLPLCLRPETGRTDTNYSAESVLAQGVPPPL